MIELLQKGGILMYPIIALSILAFAIFMERMYSLRKNKCTPTAFFYELKDLLQNNKYDQAESVCASSSYSLAKTASAAISGRGHSWEHLNTVAEEAGRRETERLSRFQETMSTIVALAPLLGLLGTVFGMINIFSVLSSGGVGNAQALSGGIAEALLTTAAGLSVAIPSQIFHHIIRYRADIIATELEKQTSDIVNIIFDKQI